MCYFSLVTTNKAYLAILTNMDSPKRILKVAGAGFEPRDLKVMGLARTPGFFRQHFLDVSTPLYKIARAYCSPL